MKFFIFVICIAPFEYTCFTFCFTLSLHEYPIYILPNGTFQLSNIVSFANVDWVYTLLIPLDSI